MYGVSPAYFFSKYGTDFTTQNYIEGIKDLSALGFESFQGEIFKKDEIENWNKDKGDIRKTYLDENLKMSLFVAHFLIESTSSFENLESSWGYEELKRVISIVGEFSEVKTIVIPISPYNYKGEDYKKIEEALHNRFYKYLEAAKGANLNIALEIIPSSIIGGSDGLLRLIDAMPFDNLGYNLDTGHAYCSGEVMELLPFKLQGKIFGTHLKDNFGEKNLALPPGKGNIDFTTLLNNLRLSSFNGSLDLEIGSERDNLIDNYKFGIDYLKSLDK